ncbi:MAG: M56 family metallopeptidase [Eubacteriales bacterium]|nr:M56 family metallopeptidase [Eubacteriales bacterium]
MKLPEMSFYGAVMILIIVIVRAFLIDKLPKKTFLALWMAALVRLLIPFSIPSAASIYTLAQTNAPAMDTVSRIPVKQIFPVQTPEKAPEQPAIPVQEDSPVNVWIILWTVGAFLCLGFFTFTYVRCYREFQMSIPVDNEMVHRWRNAHPSKRRIAIRQSDLISSPLSYGIVHPVILMPKSTNWENTAQLSYVLEHEYIHIKHFDAVTKLVVIAALSLHWFNPFVWVLYVLLNRDIELSCDEAVVRRFGEDIKSAYAMTLIHMEEQKSGLTPFCNNFGKNAIEERIRSIMKIRKVSFVTSIFAVVLVIGIASTFATSAGVRVTVEKPQMEEMDTSDQNQIVSGETTVGYDREAITARLTELNLLIDQTDAQDQETIEAAQEEKHTLEGMLEDLERKNFFETAYGDYGVSYQLPENRLYKNGRPVMSFYDEKNGGAIWWDNDGEVNVEVIRNNASEILRLFEESAEK